MGKKKEQEDSTALTGEQQKRLDELAKSWDGEPSFFPGKLSLFDLRLLLEHFPPLQALIRALAAPDDSAALAADSPRPTPPAAKWKALESELHDLEAQLAETQASWRQSQAEAQRLKQTLSAAQAELQQNQERLRRLEAENTRLARERDQATRQLAALAPHPLLTIIQRLPDLAEAFALIPPADANPQEALIRAVAILSQRENIERLWDHLKDRCNRDRRPAHAEELEFLTTALAWHNLNWQRPYQLQTPPQGSSYQYDSQQRCTAASTGERIQAVWLPGIADPNGNPLRKALVATAP
jgi:DNA repair exonuclease SbcCD ATPase subunit